MPPLRPTCDESEKHDQTPALPKTTGLLPEAASLDTVLRRQGAPVNSQIQACACHGEKPRSAFPSAPGQPSKGAQARNRPPVHLRQREAAPGGGDRQGIAPPGAPPPLREDGRECNRPSACCRQPLSLVLPLTDSGRKSYSVTLRKEFFRAWLLRTPATHAIHCTL